MASRFQQNDSVLDFRLRVITDSLPCRHGHHCAERAASGLFPAKPSACKDAMISGARHSRGRVGELEALTWTNARARGRGGGGRGEVTSIYKPYRYMPPKRVSLSSISEVGYGFCLFGLQ